MIKKISFINPQNEILELELKYPEKSGYSVIEILGLTPVKADFKIDQQSGSAGGKVDSFTLSPRNIVLTLKYKELDKTNDRRHYLKESERNGATVEDLVLYSYRFFPVHKILKILIETDSRSCYTYGYVESNTPVLFSPDCGAQISIICPDPKLYSMDKQTTIFNGIESAFEFPFSNESLTKPKIEFGFIKNFTQKEIYYDGEGDIGINIIMHAVGPVNNIIIYNTQTKEILSLNSAIISEISGSDIIAGDTIIISTLYGAKTVTLIRDGIEINILNSVGKRPSWFTLIKGWNGFAYYATFGLSYLQFRIENNTAYEGV